MIPFLQKLATDHHLEFWLGEIDRTWSVRDLRGRVIEVVEETHDVQTFVIEPNRHFRGHRAGQFITVDVELDGVTTRRCYSISSAPGGRTFSITVKRSGRVSGWLHDNVVAGDVLSLGQPGGSFVMPAVVPTRALLISGGSGITPLMSMLRDLSNKNGIRDLVFLHAARSEADVIFATELRRLARWHHGLRSIVHIGELDAKTLKLLVPDFAERAAFMCGPGAMMDGLSPLWAGIEERLKTEQFSAPALHRQAGARGEERVHLDMVDSEKTLEIGSSHTLLEELEHAGHSPKSGCRMGICNTCVTRKISGLVEDLTTGEVSDQPHSDIHLCTSRAISDLTLAL